ncbi:hypothetical protein L1D24_05345 [Vibrio brasiliensis]|uniref:hypothetical protein n=1 Tax=Vibrio brasiliensis TaxID=170652 RepID=UPI001EFD045C|nr:hypothetical protein [Vibrio brasiliensis]MCG9647994.1 hypothetical protein [Vibrio brasiliensis]
MKKSNVALAVFVSFMSGCAAYDYGYDKSKFEAKGWMSTGDYGVRERIQFEAKYNDRIDYMLQTQGMPDIYATTGDWNYYGYTSNGKIFGGVTHSDTFSEDDYKTYLPYIPAYVYNAFAKYDNSLNTATTDKVDFQWASGAYEVATITKNGILLTFRGDKGSVVIYKRNADFDSNGCHAYVNNSNAYITVCDDKSAYITNNGSITNTGTTTMTLIATQTVSSQQADYAKFLEKCATKEELQKVYRRAYYTELSASGAAKAQEKGEEAVQRAKAACQDEAALQMSLGEL